MIPLKIDFSPVGDIVSSAFDLDLKMPRWPAGLAGLLAPFVVRMDAAVPRAGARAIPVVTALLVPFPYPGEPGRSPQSSLVPVRAAHSLTRAQVSVLARLVENIKLGVFVSQRRLLILQIGVFGMRCKGCARELNLCIFCQQAD